jgi:tripartite-type tricarboxylate transporter receptor subunit TctC
MPDVRESLAKTGSEVAGGTPDEFQKYIAFETGKWAKVAQTANIKVE